MGTLLRSLALAVPLLLASPAAADVLPGPRIPPSPAPSPPPRPKLDDAVSYRDAYFGFVFVFVAAGATLGVVERRRGRGRFA